MSKASLILVVGLLAGTLTGCGGILQVQVENGGSPAAPTSGAQSTGTAASLPTQPPTPAPQVTETGSSQTSFPYLKPGQDVIVTTIRMLDPNGGWGIGHTGSDPSDHVLRTVDGGINWMDMTPPQAETAVGSSDKSAVGFFLDMTHAWVVYTDRVPVSPVQPVSIWRTSDGGASWTSSQPLEMSGLNQEYAILADLGFVDERHGWVMAHMGAGMSHDYISIFTTADSGQTWQRVVDPQKENLPMSCYKNNVVFQLKAGQDMAQPAQSGWASGDCGGVMSGVFLYHSEDGGNTWQQVSLPSPGSTSDLTDLFKKENVACGATGPFFTSNQDGFLPIKCTIFDTNTTRRWLYMTQDAGQNWTPQELPVPNGLVQLINPQTGWYLGSVSSEATAENRLYMTQNAGQTWSSIVSLNWSGQPNFVDAQYGWVVAKSGDSVALVHTVNGGKTWQEIKPKVGAR